MSFSKANNTKLLCRICNSDLRFGRRSLVRQENVFSHVAVQTPIVSAAAQCQNKRGNASLQAYGKICSIVSYTLLDWHSLLAMSWLHIIHLDLVIAESSTSIAKSFVCLLRIILTRVFLHSTYHKELNRPNFQPIGLLGNALKQG